MADTASLSAQQKLAELYEVDPLLSNQLEAMSLATESEGYHTLEPRKLFDEKSANVGFIDTWTREDFLGKGIKSCKFPNDSECSICMLDYDKNSHRAVSFVHGCKHVFGKECIRAWLKQHGSSTCPICRTQLFKKCFEPRGDDEEDHRQSISSLRYGFVLQTYIILGHPEELTMSGDKMPMRQTIDNKQIERNVASEVFRQLSRRRLCGMALLDRSERRKLLIDCLEEISFQMSWTVFSREQWRLLDSALEECDTIHAFFKTRLEELAFVDDSLDRVIPWLAKVIVDAFQGAEATRNALLKHKSIGDLEALEDEPCCEGWDCECGH